MSTTVTPETISRRFWAKVNKDGPVVSVELGACWVWTGAFGANGYARLSLGGRPFDAHRISWVLHNAAVPPAMCVRHRCDNSACVNPAHLLLGTQRDNVADMDARGRRSRGERHPGARLTASQVTEIRLACAARSESHSQLADRLRRGPFHDIGEVHRREIWRHIP